MILALIRSWWDHRQSLRATSNLFAGVQRHAIASNSGSSLTFVIRKNPRPATWTKPVHVNNFSGPQLTRQ